MLTVATAQALAAAGILWQPVAGDRFTITQDELSGQVFWISDLTIEVHHYQDQTVLGFNGTTEWALDSVPLDVALWLPREDQLRELIGCGIHPGRRGGGVCRGPPRAGHPLIHRPTHPEPNRPPARPHR